MNKLENSLMATNEVANYASYNAEEIIEIDKYLLEKQSGIANTMAGALSGEIHLLIAPTGSGKSYSIINTLKKFNIKSVFILPNSANVEQAMKEYNIPGAYGDLSAKDALLNGNMIVMTWDKASQLVDVDLSDFIVVVDEIHQTYTDMYRGKAIKGLNNILGMFKGRIDITATPNKLDFSIYNRITEYKQSKQTEYKVKLYNNIDTKTIIEILNKSKNGALLLNNKKELKYISQMMNKENDIITSDTKEHSKLYDLIMQNSNMGDYKVLLNTTTIVAGINIKNPDITDIIIVGIKDIGTIKQYVARFRDLEKCNVHIFNTYKEENTVYEIEWLVNETIKSHKGISIAYNNEHIRNTQFEELKLEVLPLKLDGYITFNKTTNLYEVDECLIRATLYNQYYNKRTIESFKVLLEEHFKDIEKIEDIKTDEVVKKDLIIYKSELKEDKKVALEVLEKHKKILVGYEDVKKDKRPYSLMEYQNINNLSMEHCQKEYLKHGIHELIATNSLKSPINLYSKYVLENNFSTDVAWNIAHLGNRKRGLIFAKVNTLVYKELKEEHPNLIDEYTIEARIYNWIVENITVGMSYTKEHLEILADAFKITFKDNWTLSSKKIGEILNQIYKINSSQIKSVNPVDTLFYRNIIPTALTEGKKTKINTIKSFITIDDIKEELCIKKSDKSLEVSIDKRKNKLLSRVENPFELLENLK